jgi:hypothetical protein
VKKDTSVNIRLTSELRAELQRLADADGRKLSAYIERLLQLHVKETDHHVGHAAERPAEPLRGRLGKAVEALEESVGKAQGIRAALQQMTSVPFPASRSAGFDEPPATAFEEDARRANLQFHQALEKATQELAKTIRELETSGVKRGEKRARGTSGKARR